MTGLPMRLGDPARGRLVERLAGAGRARAALDRSCFAQVRRVLLLQHAHRRRRAEHRRDAGTSRPGCHQMPASGRIGRPSYRIGRHAGDQRAVDDVAVADDPADVAGREVGLAGAAAEDVLHARRQRDRVAAGVALHALRLAGGAAGVERVARVRRRRPRRRAPASSRCCSRSAGVVLVAAGARGPSAPGRDRPAAPCAGLCAARRIASSSSGL